MLIDTRGNTYSSRSCLTTFMWVGQTMTHSTHIPTKVVDSGCACPRLEHFVLYPLSPSSHTRQCSTRGIFEAAWVTSGLSSKVTARAGCSIACEGSISMKYEQRMGLYHPTPCGFVGSQRALDTQSHYRTRTMGRPLPELRWSLCGRLRHVLR